MKIIWSSNSLIDRKIDRIRFAKKFYNFSIACSMRWITKGNKALWERYFRMTKHIFHKVFMFPVYAFSFKQSGLSKYHITLYIKLYLAIRRAFQGLLHETPHQHHMNDKKIWSRSSTLERSFILNEEDKSMIYPNIHFNI